MGRKREASAGHTKCARGEREQEERGAIQRKQKGKRERWMLLLLLLDRQESERKGVVKKWKGRRRRIKNRGKWERIRSERDRRTNNRASASREGKR